MGNASRIQLGRIGRVVVALSLLTPLLLLSGNTRAEAAGGLTFRADTTYTVDVDAGHIDVNNHLTLTNVTPNKRSGNRITQYYYDRISIPIPIEAEDIVATSGGRTLSLDLEEDEGYYVAEIRLRSRLFYKSTHTVDINFTLPGDAPRSKSLMRVNPAYVSFFAWAWGDPGKSSVSVVVPERFKLDFGEAVMPRIDSDQPGMAVYRAEEIQDPVEWFSWVSGTRDSALLESEFDIGSAEIKVLSWPGDDAWLDEVQSTLEDGLPALIDAVGLDWPVDGDLIVRESVAPNRFGYAGWYFTEEDEIEMGEELDPIVILHEASHAWFNDDLFEERWLGEGLASATAGHVARTELGEQELPRIIRNGDKGEIALNSWSDGPNSEEREQFAYNASWWIIFKLIDEVGIDAFNDVIVAADADLYAYRGAPDPETAVEGPDDWRRFLDLVQELSGSEIAPELFDEYVVNTLDAKRLEERAAAREELAGLETAAGDWMNPIVIRRPMENWDFEAATTAIAEAREILELRDELEARSEAGGFAVSDQMQATYEMIDGTFAGLETFVASRMDAMDAIDAAAAELAVEPDLMTQIGLWRSVDPSLKVDAARETYDKGFPIQAHSLADEAVADWAAARELGVTRARNAAIAAGVALALLLLLVVWRLVRRRRRRAAAAAVEAAAQQDLAYGPHPWMLEAAAPDAGPEGLFDDDPVPYSPATEPAGHPIDM